MLIERHVSWLAINNIVGCPNKCCYCFLKEGTGIKPQTICTPEEAVGALLQSKLYKKLIPVCVMVNTDAFSTSDNKQQLFELLRVIRKRGLDNLIIVTKREISIEDCIELRAEIEKGLRLLVYVSYSGLPENFEKGIRKDGGLEALRSIKNLHSFGIDCLHYWRPLIPENCTQEILTTVFDNVSKYCRGSVLCGLKMYSGMINEIKTLWPDAYESYISGCNPEFFVPKGALNKIYSLAKSANYNVYIENVCALADIQKIPCRYGLYKSGKCTTINKCSQSQQARCRQLYKDNEPDTIQLYETKSLPKLLDIIEQTGHKVVIKDGATGYWQTSFTNAGWVEL